MVNDKMNSAGRIVSVNISEKRGVQKTPVSSIDVEPGHGIKGDAHAGPDPVRQVSMLAIESHQKMIQKGADVKPGDFAENITTEGIDVMSLPVGSRLRSGDVKMEVTQIGKECHSHCAIYRAAGDCVMPREGIFVKILAPGSLKPGDLIEIL